MGRVWVKFGKGLGKLSLGFRFGLVWFRLAFAWVSFAFACLAFALVLLGSGFEWGLNLRSEF